MSADLFAAFESAPPLLSGQQAGVQSPPANTDPFSLLVSSAPPPPQQQQQQQSPPPISQLASFQQRQGQHQQQQQQQLKSQDKWNEWVQPQVTQPQIPPVWGNTSSFGAQPPPDQGSSAATQDDDDGWGDFEVAPTKLPEPWPAISSPKVDLPPPPRTRVTRASTIDLMTNKLLDLELGSTTLEPWQERPSWEKPVVRTKQKPPSRNPDPNVLFDAEDFELQGDVPEEEEEDDFGDFETETAHEVTSAAPTDKSAFDLLSSISPAQSAHTKQPKKQPPGLLLSSAGLTTDPLPYPQAPKSPYGSFQNRKPEQVRQLKVATPITSEFPRESKQAKNDSPTPVTAWPTVDTGEFNSSWDEFKDLPPSKTKPAPPTVKPMPSKAQPPSDWEWCTWGDSEEKQQNPINAAGPSVAFGVEAGPPPTNIPPPSVLLSIFPQLLNLAGTSLLKPAHGLPSSAQQRVLSDPATTIFLRGYVALATVAGRIIAGRKQRWHRDKFLAQGMTISTASSSKTRGMKLAGVDKAQAAHEDREAAEVVAVWKQQVGRLRSAVAAANAGLRVPELSVTLSAHTAQGVPTAPKACVICGLKRDERIGKVDVEVEDSFGEWWVEFWGHRDCRNFWLEHEVKLRQR